MESSRPVIQQSDNGLLEFYAIPGALTDPGKFAPLFDSVPDNIPALCEVVQGLLLHLHWAEQYGVALSDERKEEANLRLVSKQLEIILELDGNPLSVKRPKEKRVIGTCRDFTAFLCAILRYKGIPARARCGFGAYFMPGRFEDHWVCEYWKTDEARWVMVDAQLDRFQRTALKIPFNSTDMPPGHFFFAGDAWQKCRRGEADPDKFGIFNMHGMWFIGGNVVRDMLALNKVELLPWDIWPMMTHWESSHIDPADEAWLDRIAGVTMEKNLDLAEIQRLCREDTRLHPPTGWPTGKFNR